MFLTYIKLSSFFYEKPKCYQLKLKSQGRCFTIQQYNNNYKCYSHWVGHCEGWVKIKFNNKSSHRKIESKQRWNTVYTVI